MEEAYCPKSADPVQPEVQSEQAVQLPEGLVGFKPVIHRKTAALARQMTRKPTGHFKRRCKIKSKNAKISNAKDKLISLGRDCMDFNYLLSSIPGPQFKATGTQSDVPEGKQTGPSNTEESLPILNKAKAGPVILTIKVPGQVTTDDGTHTEEALQRFLFKRCFKRNNISQTGWKVIWSKLADKVGRDSIFTISCEDSSIMDIARMDFDQYMAENSQSEDDCHENPHHWFLRARGEHWLVEPGTFNQAAGNFCPDSLQPPRLRQVKIRVNYNGQAQQSQGSRCKGPKRGQAWKGLAITVQPFSRDRLAKKAQQTRQDLRVALMICKRDKVNQMAKDGKQLLKNILLVLASSEKISNPSSLSPSYRKTSTSNLDNKSEPTKPQSPMGVSAQKDSHRAKGNDLDGLPKVNLDDLPDLEVNTSTWNRQVSPKIRNQKSTQYDTPLSCIPSRLRGSRSDLIQARAEPASPDKATGTRVDSRIPRGTTSKAPQDPSLRPGLNQLRQYNDLLDLEASADASPAKWVSFHNHTPHKEHTPKTSLSQIPSRLPTLKTVTETSSAGSSRLQAVTSGSVCAEPRSRSSTVIKPVQKEQLDHCPQFYDVDFPQTEVGQKLSLTTNKTNQCSPSTTCNMYFSKHSRSPPADARACATCKLDSTTLSGRLSRKSKWQARKDILSKIFNFSCSRTLLIARQNSELSHWNVRPFIPGPPKHASVTTKYSNFCVLNRPRHGYLKKKARYNSKHYG